MSQGIFTSHNPEIDIHQIKTEVADLCSLHIAPLCRYAASLTNKKDLIGDAIQETFLRYFILKAGGRKIGNPRRWLMSVLGKLIRKRCREEDRLILSNEWNIQDEPDITDPEKEKDTDTAYLNTLNSLSRHERECLWLSVQGYEYKDIASITRMRNAEVGRVLNRVLEHFRKAGLLTPHHQVVSDGPMDTYCMIAELRHFLAELQYRRRVKRRVYAYLACLGLLSAVAAAAAVLIK
jgi:RNA polymerase sigma factor (sigma-70 family)